MLNIKRVNGVTAISLDEKPVGSLVHRELMAEHYVKLPFTLADPVYLRVGDYLECDFGRFELMKPYRPKYNPETSGYDYTLQMDAYYMKWENKKCKYLPETTANEVSFHLTATAEVHMNVIIRNVNALGEKDSTFLYNGQSFVYELRNFPSSKVGTMKYIQYSNLGIISALNAIATAFECEWWVEGNVIYLGKCLLSGEEVEFTIDENVESMNSSESSSEYATRIMAFGSTRNLPKDYRKNSSADVTVDGVVQKRLMLPVLTCPNGYIQDSDVQNESEAIEGVYIDEDIYPKTECVVSEVIPFESTVDNGDGTTTTQTFYRLKDSSGLDFSNSYRLEGEELRMVFQSGLLNGMDFECIYNDDEEYYEVVVNEDYGRALPDDTLKPRVGDTFVLYGWDVTKIGNTGLIDAAEARLETSAIAKLGEMKVDPNTYTCEMYSDWYSEWMDDNQSVVFSLGQPVILNNLAYFPDGRSSRVIGYELKLDVPYDSPQYIIGESLAYSRSRNMEQQLESIKVNGASYSTTSGGGGGVYLITSTDRTPASDYNVFSAQRSLIEFVRKKGEEIITGAKIFADGLSIKAKNLFGFDGSGNAKVNDLTADGDMEVKGNGVFGGLLTALRSVINSVQSSDFSGHSSTDTGWAITNDYTNGKSRLTVDDMYVRGRAIFEQLLIKQKQVSGGDEVQSCASSYISRVDYLDENGNPMGYSEVQVPWVLNGMMRYLTNSLRTQILTKLQRTRSSLTTDDLPFIKTIRCYFLASDGDRKVQNLWKVGDLAYCKTIDLDEHSAQKRDDYAPVRTKMGNIFWWRKVIAVSDTTTTLDDSKQYHWFDVKFDYNEESKNPDSPFFDDETPEQQRHSGNFEWCEAHSDMPAADDSVVQLGHVPTEGQDFDQEGNLTDDATGRMSAYMSEMNGQGNADAPCLKLLYGIYTYDLTKCWFGGPVVRMNLSLRTGFKFFGPSFKFVQQYDVVRIPTDRGLWTNITPERDDYEPHDDNVRKCYFYDRVSHNGSLWLCKVVEGQHWIAGETFSQVIDGTETTFVEGNYISNATYAKLTFGNKEKCDSVENYTILEPGDETSAQRDVWEKQVSKGESITKQSETYRYATNNTGIRPAASSSDWQTTKPTLQQGYWLFTETTITWSDGSTTVLYTDERNPNDGVSGQDIIVDGATEMKYAVSNSNTTQPTTWYNYADIVSQIVPGKWLWTKATTYYRKASSAAGSHDAGSSTNYSVGYIGTNGTNGRAVSAVSEHYNVSNSSSTSWNVPSSGTWTGEWSTDPNQSSWGDNNKYLWNYEKITYTNSDGSTTISRTAPSVVAVWTKDGKGIDSITNYYKITNNLTPPSRIHEEGSGWDDDPIAPTSENPYLWNYEKIHWTDNTDTYTDVQMIGHFGSDGAKGLYYVEDYGRSKSRTSVESPNLDTSYGTNGWGATAPSPTDVYPYIWKRSRQYNPNTQTYGTASYVCETGEKGTNGKDGWMITAAPANVILTESRSNNQSTFTTAVVSFTAKKGGVNATITGISTPSSAEFNVSKNGSSGTAAKQVKVTSPKTSGGSYYTEGSFKVDVYVTDPDTNQSVTFNDVTVPCYTNLLGTWQESIEDGVKTELGHLREYVDEQDGALQEDYDAKITKSAKGLTQQFSEKQSKAGSFNRNLFGFHKGCLITDSPWPSVPFIQGYGIIVNRSQTDGSNTRRRAMISSLGLGGVGGSFVVSFMAKVSSGSGSMYVNICDVDGKVLTSSVSSDVDKTYVSLSTTWRTFTMRFALPDTISDNKDFIVFGDNTGTIGSSNIYIRHLKIERGDIATCFVEADEDLEYKGGSNLINGITKQNDIIGPELIDNRTCYYKENAPSSNKLYLQSQSGITFEAGKIYTLSFWAKCSLANGYIIRSYCDGDIGNDTIGYKLYDDGKTGSILEGARADGDERIRLSNTWKQYFIHLYVSKSNNVTTKMNILATYYGDNSAPADVWISDIKLQEGFVVTPSDFTSIFEQTARRINMEVEDGLSRTGIDITAGLIKATTDNFVIQNSAGENTFSVDAAGNLISKGNAAFGGIIKSKGIYQNMGFFSTSNDSVSYLRTYADGHTTMGDYVAPQDYSSHYDDGYVMTNCEYVGCGLLDIVFLQRDWPDRHCIYIPNPSGIEGKQIEIYKGDNNYLWHIGTDPNVANWTFFDATYRHGTIQSNYIQLSKDTMYVRLLSNGTYWYILERRDIYGNITALS